MKAWPLLAVGLMLSGCSIQPILNDQAYQNYCTTPGVCESYLRSRIMQYHTNGSIVVGPNGPGCRAAEEKIICR